MPRRPVRRRSRASRALRWLAAATLLVISLAYVRPLHAYFEARRNVAAAKADVVRLHAEHVRLAHRLAVAGTDAFVEQQARRLGLVKPGERLFIVKGLRATPRLR